MVWVWHFGALISLWLGDATLFHVQLWVPGEMLQY